MSVNTLVSHCLPVPTVEKLDQFEPSATGDHLGAPKSHRRLHRQIEFMSQGFELPVWIVEVTDFFVSHRSLVQNRENGNSKQVMSVTLATILMQTTDDDA